MSYVVVEKQNGIGTIALNRPEKLNAMNGEMADDLRSGISDLASNESVHVVIITGSGRGFCAGGDIDYFQKLLETKNEKAFGNLLETGRKIVTTIHTMPKPVIAAVNGPAAGGGFCLAIACDIRLASDKSSFGASFVKIGLHPDWGGSWFLPRIVGPSKACELVFSGEQIGAEEAKEIGLVNQIYPALEFTKKVREFGEMLAARPQKTIALAKRMMWEAHEREFEQTLEEEREIQFAAFKSEDAREGIRAFLEKRKPTFQGK